MTRASGQIAPKFTDVHRIAITGIVWRKGKKGREYLITRRSLEKKVHPGKWTVPGGGLETNDYLPTKPTKQKGTPQWYGVVERALKREIKEEVGVTIADARYLCDITFIRPDGIPVLVLSYFCKWKRGKAHCGEDTIDLAWIPAKGAKKYDLIEGIAEEIVDADRLLAKRG